MIKSLFVIAIPTALFLSAGQEEKNQTHQQTAADRDAITRTALDYAQSWYEGNPARMERALHPDLAKRVLKPNPPSAKGKIDHMSALTLIQGVRRGHGTKVPTDRRRTDVTILDVYGNAASVKLEMHDWIDYMHMSKMDGRWVIVNVLWELTPQAKTKRGIPNDL